MVEQETVNFKVRGSNPRGGATHHSAHGCAISRRKVRDVPHGTSPIMKFYYVYILHNFPKDFIYIGYSEDIKQRIVSHNKGENKSTKTYIPLELIHYEAYRSMKDAKRRELYLKSNKGKTTLMTMLKEYFRKL